jgi:inosine-uridine nucleoside N-ribohydrolase
MKKIILGLFIFLLSCSQQPKVAIIFDTDIGPDYDDVGAMALLHAFADNNEAKILATISCNAFETTAPTLSVLNTYFNRPEIPIGIVNAEKPREACRQGWAQYINAKYPHKLNSNADAVEAVSLYRKILSEQPDSSVTVVTVGFFTNLANLLDSPGDAISPLTGMELIRKKIKILVSMAARMDAGTTSGREFNVHVDALASRKVFAEWPTPMLLSGFEIGAKILTGTRLIADNEIQNSPVKDAFKIALEKDNNTIGRNSWDQTAVLVAVRGWEPFFGLRKVNFEIQDDGTNVLIPGEKFMYLTEKMPPAETAKVIEDLMMHEPK